MQIETYLSQVRDQLVAAAALGDDRTREIAGALTVAAVPAVRLALFAAVSETADEITAALLDHPGSPAVAVRLDGDQVAVDVRAVATTDDATPARDAEEATARISLRLTDSLKADIDAAAEGEGVSVNTWLVRAAADALRRGRVDTAEVGRVRGRTTNNH
ncbi:MAG: hypothetical protein QOJ83_1472, partial [Frankiales bacterium]|nr:hypothetical protein [Frankiales bacterium]